MSKKKRSEIALAIVDLRSVLNENQQRFSDRLGIALATLARWEIDNRYPSSHYLKEMWYLATEHGRPQLGEVFSKAFFSREGYAIRPDRPKDFTLRRLAEIRDRLSSLINTPLDGEELTAKI